MEFKKENRGRKPLALGEKKPPQATVKINSFILPFVTQLKSNLKKGLVTKNTLSLLFDVLNKKGEQQLSVFKDPAAASIVSDLQEKIRVLETEKQIIAAKLHFIQNNNVEDPKVAYTKGKLESLKSSYRMLKLTHDELLHREYDCMAITVSGERCNKPAKLDAAQNGLMIHVCLQHSKLVNNKKERKE